MGLFGLLGNKKKKSEQSAAPDISDLPPIPEPNSDMGSQPTNVNSTDSGVDDLSLDSLPELPSDDLSLDSSNTSNTSDLSNSKNSDLSSDAPVPDLSFDDSNKKDSEENKSPVNTKIDDSSKALDTSSKPADNVSKDVGDKDLSSDNNLSSQSLSTKESEGSISDVNPKKDVSNQTSSSPPETSNEVDASKKEDNDSSLPLFDDVSSPDQIDIDSLSVSELFIKKEQYGEVLETLNNAQKELNALVKKSEVVKPNEKIGTLLKKSTTIHADLNKGLMFVEDHLIE